MKLIDKEILLLKIDSKIEEAQKVFNVAPSSVIGGMIEGYTRTKKIISSLEVKEVDLKKEFSQWWKGERTKDYNVDILYERYPNASIKLAKHFFELGMAVSNKAQKGEEL